MLSKNLDGSRQVKGVLSLSYELIECSSLKDCASHLKDDALDSNRRLLIHDSNVPKRLIGTLVNEALREGLQVSTAQLPGGEHCKNMDQLMELAELLSSFNLNRRTEPVIAVGGGALLDLVAFAAGIYRRGVPIIKVPTTILAYVDASVGIKTAVNFAGRKNLLGTFSPPDKVILYRGFFESLPLEEVRNGLGEVLKLAVGCNARLFEMMESTLWHEGFESKLGTSGGPILDLSIDAMLEQLNDNLFENDLNRAVDLGHTFSQTFELMMGGNGLRHGEAVAVDVVLTCAMAVVKGALPSSDFDRVLALYREIGLPTQMAVPSSRALAEALLERTLHRGGKLRLPVPVEIGRCVFMENISARDIQDGLNLMTKHGVL